ncbi:MAG: helix-turn-helix domain-containing protein [Deltaproteobacteria bacterium]|nr:helix-turn-helix domain-containing protein [Deltaproteobacteria bacterium]
MKVADATEFGAQIRARRKEKGLSQGQLAELCAVSVRFVSEVERGRASASVGLVLHLCTRLALDVLVEPREQVR